MMNCILAFLYSLIALFVLGAEEVQLNLVGALIIAISITVALSLVGILLDTHKQNISESQNDNDTKHST